MWVASQIRHLVLGSGHSSCERAQWVASKACRVETSSFSTYTHPSMQGSALIYGVKSSLRCQRIADGSWQEAGTRLKIREISRQAADRLCTTQKDTFSKT
jgi:hypothetical protein